MERLKRVSDCDQVIGQNGGAPFDRANDQGAARQSRTRREDIQAARAVATFGPALKCCLLITECFFGRQSPLVHARYSQYEACFPDAPVIVGHAFGREDGQFVSGDAGRNAGSVEKPGNLLAIWELGHGRTLAVCFVFAQSGQEFGEVAGLVADVELILEDVVPAVLAGTRRAGQHENISAVHHGSIRA